MYTSIIESFGPKEPNYIIENNKLTWIELKTTGVFISLQIHWLSLRKNKSGVKIRRWPSTLADLSTSLRQDRDPMRNEQIKQQIYNATACLNQDPICVTAILINNVKLILCKILKIGSRSTKRRHFLYIAVKLSSGKGIWIKSITQLLSITFCFCTRHFSKQLI